MVSRENTVVLAFGVGALVTALVGAETTQVDTGVLAALLLFGGVVAPLLVNGYLDSKGGE